MNEAEIIARIASAFGGLVAPGAYDFVDDAAMIPPVTGGARVGAGARVITTDMIVEGVDFDRALYPLAYAGYRALAQNLSDVAAMGAAPVGFVWSLAIPPGWSIDDVADFARGAAILAKLRKVPLFGGDLSSTSGPFVCSITAFGDVDGLPVRRSGAQPGDGVYLSAKVGGAAAGLRLLRARGAAAAEPGAFEAWLRALPEAEAACVQAHVRPLPGDGSLVAGHATACIDVSDGFAIDANRLARASHVRLELDVDVPVADGATPEEALHGGEDYALLFTAPTSWKRAGELIRIGTVAAAADDDSGSVSVNGAVLAGRGFDHFARG